MLHSRELYSKSKSVYTRPPSSIKAYFNLLSPKSKSINWHCLSGFPTRMLYSYISHILNHTLWVVSTGAASKLGDQHLSFVYSLHPGYVVATGWMVRGLNAGGGEIFCTRPEGPWSPPSFLYNGYRVFPIGKAVGVWR